MARIIHITPKARGEILLISHWWSENRSTEHSLRWYEGIMERINSLTVMPQSNPLIYENLQASSEFREAYFGLSTRKTHRIVYRVLPDAIEVLAVRHVAQDSLSDEDLR